MLGGNESYIYGISNFTINTSPITFKVSKYVDAIDDLQVKIGSTVVATRTNVSGSSAGDTTGSITFNSTELNNIYKAMPKVTKATFTFALTTKIGGTVIGSQSTTAIGTLPDTIKPAITKVNLIEAVSGLATKFGGFVKNKSQLNYSYTKTIPTGTTITSYQLTIDGSNYIGESGTTGTIKTSGTINYSAYCIDSRGRRSNTFSGTINVLDYFNPQLTTFNVIRCNAQGIENNEGAYAKYTIDAAISSVNNKNDKSIVIDYKKQKDSTWTTWKTYTGGYTLKETSAVLGISTDDAYHFRVRLTDYFNINNPSNKIIPLSSAFTIMDLLEDGTGVAFGKVASESDTFDVGFKKTFLSDDTYLGGQDNNDAEKNLFFTNTGNGLNKHNVKLYGGNGNSITSIGMWDVIKDLPIFQYFDGDDYRLKFGDNIILKWGSYDIESVLAKVFSSATGRYRTKTGLLLQWGSVSITPVANTPTSVNVTFPIDYDVTPNIQVSAVSGVPYTNVLGYSHLNDSATGTTLTVARTNTTATVLRWFAIGFKEI